MSSTASVASSTDSLQGVEQDSEAATPGSSSFEVSSISVSINNSITSSKYIVQPDHTLLVKGAASRLNSLKNLT